ncbi:MAG: signal peptidase II [Thermoflexales bacterium]|nr:signal peptidase II [Thermoflexales bacterium]MDW8350595.1 signal peptidase II [Anaerolineae bacterium]
MSEEARITESNAPADRSGRSAVISHLRRYWLLLLAASIALILDIVTKRIVEAQIPLYTSIPVIGPYLSWTHTQNTGAAFSLFPNGGVFFIIVALVVSAVILYYAPRLPAGDWLSRVALGMQLGGAIGNLLDRLRQGYVTDFIHFQIPEIGFDWPVFNIADSAIVVGVILLIAASLLRDHKS